MNSRDIVKDWIKTRNETACLKNNFIGLSKVNEWVIDDEIIEHSTGRFFSIIPISAIDKNTGDESRAQPIINQPEIGLLGFVFRKQGNNIEILVQAKTEPGNCFGTQLAPTVQATYSNYMRVHQGEPTRYLDLFVEDEIWKNEGTLQSEQGSRFYGKYNRNVSIFLNNHHFINDGDNWKWFNLSDVLSLLDLDFVINTDARSVLVCSDWDKLSGLGKAFKQNFEKSEFGRKLHDSFYSKVESIRIQYLQSELFKRRQNVSWEIKKLKFSDLKDWQFDNPQQEFVGDFSIIGIDVSVKGREVESWQQPLLKSNSKGEVILFCKLFNGVLHFMVGFSEEIGYKEKIQFGPTIIKIDGSFNSPKININPESFKLISNYKQSDEGGRFYQSVVDYSLFEIDEKVEIEETENFVWMTLAEIKKLMEGKGNFTNEFRSVLSLVLKFL